MFQRDVIESYLPQVDDLKPVAHYTRIGNLPNFLKTPGAQWVSAWATPVQFLNDRRELTIGLETLRDVASEVPKSRKIVRSIIDDLLFSSGSIISDGFQMSFSMNSDELGQWRAYASNGLGCSVVTRAGAIRGAASVAGPIIYEPAKQHAFAVKVKQRLRGMTDRVDLTSYIIAAACFMKQEGFMPEAEFRMLRFASINEVKFRESGDRLVPFMDYLEGRPPIPVDKIVIGPSWQLSSFSDDQRTLHHVVQGVSRLLEARGLLSNVDVDYSKIPFDPR